VTPATPPFEGFGRFIPPSFLMPVQQAA